MEYIWFKQHIELLEEIWIFPKKVMDRISVNEMKECGKSVYMRDKESVCKCFTYLQCIIDILIQSGLFWLGHTFSNQRAR